MSSELLSTDEACPVCASNGPRLVYGLPEFRIVACQSCEQVYLRPLPSPEKIRDMFSRLYTSGEGSVLATVRWGGRAPSHSSSGSSGLSRTSARGDW